MVTSCAKRGDRDRHTNLHELAYGVTGANALRPRGKPDRARVIPGGSSSGSGAAVAAALAASRWAPMPAALSSALAAAWSVSSPHDTVTREGVHALAWTLDHIGPLARSVADAALG